MENLWCSVIFSHFLPHILCSFKHYATLNCTMHLRTFTHFFTGTEIKTVSYDLVRFSIIICVYRLECKFALIEAFLLLFIVDSITPFRWIFSPICWKRYISTAIKAPFLQDDYTVGLHVSCIYRLTTEAHYRKRDLLATKLSCKSWLCQMWYTAPAFLFLHSCVREDFCHCTFRPLYNQLKPKGVWYDIFRPERCQLYSTHKPAC